MKEIIKKIKKTFVYKFIKLVLIPGILIAFWIAASLLFNNRVSFSVLLFPQSNESIQVVSNDVEKYKITGTFKAADENLGLVLFKFKVNPLGSLGIITFKIKQEGDGDWYQINTYREDLLSSGELLPLGFPVISDSKNKTYQFEMSSQDKSVAIENTDFFSGYEFSKNELITNKKEGLSFLIKKTFTSFTNFDFFLSSIRYLIPLGFYLSLYFISTRLKIKANTKKFENAYIALPLFLILADIFFIRLFYLPVLIVLILFWLYSSWKMKLESKTNFVLAFTLIIIWIVLILFQIADFQSKINIWGYTFFVLGVLSAVKEEMIGKNK